MASCPSLDGRLRDLPKALSILSRMYLTMSCMSFIMYPAWVYHIICHEALRFEPTASLA